MLPDRLHCIWSLPENDTHYPGRLKEIKRFFTNAYLHLISPGELRNASRLKKGKQPSPKVHFVWQRRFWEHVIRDQEDFNRHMDYIHFNQLKHGLVKEVVDWQWSPFHRYVKIGIYDKDWGGDNDDKFSNLEVGK